MRSRLPPAGAIIGVAAALISLGGAFWVSHISGRLELPDGLDNYLEVIAADALVLAGFAASALAITTSLLSPKRPLLPRPARFGAVIGIAGGAVLLVGITFPTLLLAGILSDLATVPWEWVTPFFFIAPIGLPIFATGIALILARQRPMALGVKALVIGSLAAMWVGTLWFTIVAFAGFIGWEPVTIPDWNAFFFFLPLPGYGGFALVSAMVLWRLAPRAIARPSDGSTLTVTGASLVLVSGCMAITAAFTEVRGVHHWLRDLSLVGFNAVISIDVFLSAASLAIFALGFSLFLWGLSRSPESAPSSLKRLKTVVD